ncbi:MAG: zinc ribbon domain-containing protein, partial [Clostridia bacterium]|nr:zinc ribbon domain-containing protein [Clostridia bacterium]
MTCPECGTRLKRGLTVCPECGADLTHVFDVEKSAEAREWESTLTVFMKIVVWVLTLILSFIILAFGIYKLYYWIEADSVQRAYARGDVRMPELEAISMSDGREGHAVTFYGNDGDSIYVEELNERYVVVGGKTRIEIADSQWFSMANTTSTRADVTLTSVLTSESGEKTLLPIISFTVDMPSSPLIITQPTENNVTTLSSSYDIKMNVVYGSTVLVGGEDVSSMVTRQGDLSVAVAIYAVGNNPISILVQTPNHLETRADLVFYRQPMDIDLSLSPATTFTSTLPSKTVRGSVDPLANLTIESPYEDGSFTREPDGSFSFIADFTHYGDNQVVVRAQMDGHEDAVMAFDISYVPTIGEYTRSAWAMDYRQLIYCWDIWDGKVFRCKGSIVEVLSQEPNIVVIDVSENETGQYLVI